MSRERVRCWSVKKKHLTEDELYQLKKENEQLHKNVNELKPTASKSQCYTQASLKDNVEKVKYLTGMHNYTYLIQVFSLVFPPSQNEDSSSF